MKRCSMSLIIREMQIKTTMRYYLTPVRTAIINKSTKYKCWWGCRERETLVHCWWECRLVQPLWKTVWRYLKKLKTDLPFNPAIPLLGIYPKEPRTLILKNINILMFTAVLFTISKIWKLPISRWVDKTTMGCLHNGILLSHEKEESFTFHDSMDGLGDHDATWNKPVKYLLLIVNAHKNSEAKISKWLLSLIRIVSFFLSWSFLIFVELTSNMTWDDLFWSWAKCLWGKNSSVFL